MGEPNKATLPRVRDILRQVYYDLLQSKDVQDNPTFTYTWLADQFGHFTLGFFPTYVVLWIMTAYTGVQDAARDVWVGVGVFCIWVVKEVRDFTLAYVHYKRSNSTFAFDRKELYWNVVTAWLFFAMGAVVAVLSLVGPVPALVSLPVAGLVAVFVSWWWLKRKMTFQQSGLPYLYRLAVFPNNIPVKPARAGGLDLAAAKDFIARMMDPQSKDDAGDEWSGHLILAGQPSAGKSTLAVAIGTEFVFKLGICRYLTLVKLLQYAIGNQPTTQAERAIRGSEEFNDGRIIWRWDAANLLIVDDVEDIARVTHNDNDNEQQRAEYNARVQRVLTGMFNDGMQAKMKAQKRTVWVCNDPVNPFALKQLLEKILGYTNTQVLELRQAATAKSLE